MKEKEPLLFSFRENSKHDGNKKLVLLDAEIGEIRKHARTTTGGPYQELVQEQSLLSAGKKKL